MCPTQPWRFCLGPDGVRVGALACSSRGTSAENQGDSGWKPQPRWQPGWPSVGGRRLGALRPGYGHSCASTCPGQGSLCPPRCTRGPAPCGRWPKGPGVPTRRVGVCWHGLRLPGNHEGAGHHGSGRAAAGPQAHNRAGLGSLALSVPLTWPRGGPVGQGTGTAGEVQEGLPTAQSRRSRRTGTLPRQAPGLPGGRAADSKLGSEHLLLRPGHTARAGRAPGPLGEGSRLYSYLLRGDITALKPHNLLPHPEVPAPPVPSPACPGPQPP